MFFNINNRLLIEYAIEYKERIDKIIDTLRQINFAQMKKEVYLPCELVEFDGRNKITCYRKINAKSLIW